MEGHNQQRRHHIVQTIVGPVCTSCDTRVSNNKTLFTCCANTIKSHWKKNQCSNGNPSAPQTERELLERLRELHQRSIGNKELAFEHFRDGDEGVKKSLRHHCSHCGLVDKESRLKRYHKHCPGHAIKACVLTNKYNQLVPESFLNDIVDNNSPLPRLMKNVIINPPPTTPGPAPIPSLPSPPPMITPPRTRAAASNNTTSEPPPAKRIKVTAAQLERATKPDLMFNPYGRWEVITKQMETLDDRNASKHTWFFQHICLGSGNLMERLLVDAKQQQSNYDPATDDIKLKALLHSAKLWFQSQTANIDVREIDTHLRAALYKVGSKADIDDLDIWGKTFVPTNDMEHVLKEVKYIIQFLYRGKHIENDLMNVLEEIEQASPYDDSNADRRIEDFARRILVTNLIPAIIVNSVLEEPKDANGSIPIYDYIAARSTKLRGDDIKLRNPNDISRSANAMLRVVRHAICTYLYNLSEEYKHDGNKRWRNEANEIIKQLQQAPAIGHICLRLVMAKYDQQKTPQRLKKLVDIESGDVYVAGAYFPYDRWSRAIQHAINLVEESLKLIFQNHDALEKWRHLDNNVHWSGDNNGTCVRVATEDVEAMEIIRPQVDLIPTLGEHDNDDVQNAINICSRFEKFAFAYMGVGAARGTEVMDMEEEIKDIDFVFNTIVYHLICKKGESHGRYTNEPVQHFLPPSISRIVLLIKLMLWPAVEQSSVFTIPNKSTSADAANQFFMKVFELEQSIGTKNNRQAIASMMNLICPSTGSRMTINPIVAEKFQHTEQTHNMFYSDNIIQKEGSKLIDFPLLLARLVWAAFGEPSTNPRTSSSPSNGGILRDDQYNSAARTLYGPQSQASQLQLEAIQHLDNTSAEGQSHAFVFMGTGTGKSGLYNISAAAAALHGYTIQKTLVISPHNGLLAQHSQQSKTYFQSLPIKVTSHDSTEISEQHDNPPDLDDSDLCFISIYGFQKLIKYHRNTFKQWGFQRIIIDEYHNVISEIFRFNTSWDALSNVASLGTKILCMSATANEFIMQCIAKLLGLGKYKVIGDIGSYRVPNVAILRSSVPYQSLLSTVVSEVSSEFENPQCSEFTAHVITMSITDAKDTASMLNNKGILSMSLHSECTKEERQDIMRKWNNNRLKVLVSTIHDGIDSSQCKHVYICGGPHNNMALIQSIGRIRPRQQSGSDAKVKIYDTDYPSVDGDSDEDDKRFIAKVIGAGLVGIDDQDKVSDILIDLFTRSGYKDLVKTNECLRRELLMKIGVSSERCGMCSSCLEKNNIIRSATAATAAIEEDNQKREEVFDCLKKMMKQCVVCDKSYCDGRVCLQGSNSCYGCHKSYHYCSDRNRCTLQRNAIFTSTNENRHLLCTWCFGPKGLELHDTMRHEEIYHKGDTDSEGKVVHECTFRERPKRLLLHSQTNDGRNATTYLTPKSPEQIPQNPTKSTEFLPTVDSKSYSESHFSPQNPTPLFLQSSTFSLFFGL